MKYEGYVTPEELEDTYDNLAVAHHEKKELEAQKLDVEILILEAKTKLFHDPDFKPQKNLELQELYWRDNMPVLYKELDAIDKKLARIASQTTSLYYEKEKFEMVLKLIELIQRQEESGG